MPEISFRLKCGFIDFPQYRHITRPEFTDKTNKNWQFDYTYNVRSILGDYRGVLQKYCSSIMIQLHYKT